MLERFILSEKDYLDLINEAWASNFHASTALEGNPLSKEEVRHTTRNALEGYIPPNASVPVQEIINHAFVWADSKMFKGPWSVGTIRSVHQHLMRHDEKSKPGQLRTGFERTAITNKEGEEWFFTAPGNHVKEELEELVRWLNAEAPALEPIVAACLFFHEFESIHPFEDGNGRTGRVLFHAYLQNNGFENSHKCLIEQVVTANPTLYYNILGWTDLKSSYTELVDFFVAAILESYEKAVEEFGQKNLLTTAIDENSKRLLILAKKHHDWFKLKDAMNWVDGRSEQTVRRDLQEWVGLGVLECEGNTSAKRYRFLNPLRRLFQASQTHQRPLILEQAELSESRATKVAPSS